MTRLQRLAREERAETQLDSRSCKLLGEPAECTHLSIRDERAGEILSFVLVIAQRPTLVVCAFPGELQEQLPVPCAQAIELL